MSQGSFVIAKYKTSEATPRILPIKQQPETEEGDNVQPEGEFSVGGSYVHAPGKSRKAYGIHCRYITLSRKVGTATGPYTGASVSVKVPVLDPARLAANAVGSAVTYRGIAGWVVVSYTPEKIR